MPGSLRTAGRPDLGTSLSLGPRREQGRPRWGKGEHSQTPATPGVAAVAPTTPAPASRESSRPAPAPPPSASAPPPPASAPRPTPSSATLCTSHLPAQLCPALLAARRLRAPGRRTLLCHPRMPSPSAPSPGPLPPRPRPKSPGRSPHSALSPFPPAPGVPPARKGKSGSICRGQGSSVGETWALFFLEVCPEVLRPGREGSRKKLGAVLKECFIRRTRVLLCPALRFSSEQNSFNFLPGMGEAFARDSF